MPGCVCGVARIVMTRPLLSGVQLASRAPVAIVSSTPPTVGGDILITSDLPLLLRENAIERPSGDQRGQSSSASGVLVKLTGSPPTAGMIQMLWISLSEALWENATNRPSGDSAGSSSEPGRDVAPIECAS